MIVFLIGFYYAEITASSDTKDSCACVPEFTK